MSARERSELDGEQRPERHPDDDGADERDRRHLEGVHETLLEHVAKGVAAPVRDAQSDDHSASGSARCDSMSRMSADIVQTMIR